MKAFVLPYHSIFNSKAFTVIRAKTKIFFIKSADFVECWSILGKAQTSGLNLNGVQLGLSRKFIKLSDLIVLKARFRAWTFKSAVF